MPLSLHSGKNIFMGNNVHQEQHFENNPVSFSFSSVSHRLVSASRHRDNSPQFTTRNTLRSRIQKSTPILLDGATDWSHILGPCPSSMPSTRSCNTPVAHRVTGMPQSRSKMFYFHPSGLQFALAESVFWRFMFSFHAHFASPPLSIVFFSPSSATSPSHLHIQVCLCVQCFCVYSSLLFCFVSHICFQLWPLKSR